MSGQKIIDGLDDALSGRVERVTHATVASIPDVQLLERAVRHAIKFGGKKRDPNWMRVMGTFSLGSTYAVQLCTRFGIRPDACGIEGCLVMVDPEIGSCWVHTKTRGRYIVRGFCNIEAEDTIAVLYCSDRIIGNDWERGAGITWCRPLSEFMDGRFVPSPPKEPTP